MGALLKIVDEHFGSNASERVSGVELRLVSERISAREILRQRVEAEVEEVNRRKQAHVDGHAKTRSFLIDIDAESAEAKLNMPILGKRKPKLFDVEEETKRAVAAFEKRQFIMLFDDRQVDDIDAWVSVTPESEVVFLYLTPLKGG
jgi:hypothetical protein